MPVDLPPELLEKFGISPDEIPENTPEMEPGQVAHLLRSIGGMLTQSESFRSLSPEQQDELRANTQEIAKVLEKPVEVVVDGVDPGPPSASTPPKTSSRSAPAPSATGLGAPDPWAISF